MERNAAPARRPEFFMQDGEVMFRFEIDQSNVIGPRKATARDRSEYAAEYRAFMSRQMTEAQAEAQAIDEAKAKLAKLDKVEALAQRDPLDHDGDGKKGGSLKGEQSTRAKGARRKKGG